MKKELSISLTGLCTPQLADMQKTIGEINRILWDAQKSHGIKVSYHLDIMDGQYVDSIQLCPMMIRQLATLCTCPIDMHFMTNNFYPYANVTEYAMHSPVTIVNKILTHLDTSTMTTVQGLHQDKFGITINPDEAISASLLRSADNFMLMTVIPGRGGQQFISQESKLDFLVNYRAKNNLDYRIIVDGGINADTVEHVKSADTIVVGSYFTKALTQNQSADAVKKLLDNWLC